MGLVSSAYARVFGKQETRIIMLGLDAAGKTSILYKLKRGQIETTIPTIGMHIETVEYRRKTSLVSFTAWDVGGRCQMRALWRHYYKQGNALVFVVDSADRDRYEQASDEISKVLSEDDTEGWPLLVFANKQDLPSAMSIAEVTEKLKLHSLCNRRWYIQGSCATTGEGLYEGLDWLTQAIQPKGTGSSYDSKLEEQIGVNHIPAKIVDASGSDADTDVPESVSTQMTEQEI